MSEYMCTVLSHCNVFDVILDHINLSHQFSCNFFLTNLTNFTFKVAAELVDQTVHRKGQPNNMHWFLVLASCFVLSCEGCIGPRPSPTTAPPTSSCTRYGPSPVSPSDVSRLRPGDIGILTAIGDNYFICIQILSVLYRGL